MFAFKKNTNLRRFNLMIETASAILENGERYKSEYENVIGPYSEHPLYAYIHLLGRKTQGKALQEMFSIDETEKFGHIEYYEFMHHRILMNDGLGDILKYPSELLKTTDEFIKIDLSRYLVLPWPWEYNRFSRVVNYITNWKEDESNHRVYIWNHVGVCWVGGGNHSIATGIVKGMGSIDNCRVIDISNLYDYISTNGINYYEIKTGKKICKVKDVEFAAIFEIGRIIMMKNISLKGAY